MRFKPVKSKLEKAEAVHGMVQAGMPHPLARHVATRRVMLSPKKKKP